MYASVAKPGGIGISLKLWVNNVVILYKTICTRKFWGLFRSEQSHEFYLTNHITLKMQSNLDIFKTFSAMLSHTQSLLFKGLRGFIGVV